MMMRNLSKIRFYFSENKPIHQRDKKSLVDVSTKEDLVKLKEDFLQIKVPKHHIKGRINTKRMEESLQHAISYNSSQRSLLSRHRKREVVIVDSPVTLTQAKPLANDFFNKVFKDFGKSKYFY
jgi:hypothetical protein